MSAYKVTYFNGRGRGEILRQLLTLGDQKFEDVRIEVADWPKVKPTTPFGQLPILEVDGTKIFQTNACARFLAKKFGLYGSNAIEEAQVDTVVYCVDDMMKPFFAIAFGGDPAKQAEQKKKYEEEELPNFLAKLENILSSSGKGEYFVGNKLSWADVHIAHYLTLPEFLKVQVQLDKYPKIKALKARVESNPKIKTWIAKRPVTPW